MHTSGKKKVGADSSKAVLLRGLAKQTGVQAYGQSPIGRAITSGGAQPKYKATAVATVADGPMDESITRTFRSGAWLSRRPVPLIHRLRWLPPYPGGM